MLSIDWVHVKEFCEVCILSQLVSALLTFIKIWHVISHIKNNISQVNCFNSVSEMKISFVKLIFMCERYISYVRCFANQGFTCKIFNQFISRNLGILYVKKIPISYVKWKFYTWKCSNSVCFSRVKWREIFVKDVVPKDLFIFHVYGWYVLFIDVTNCSKCFEILRGLTNGVMEWNVTETSSQLLR